MGNRLKMYLDIMACHSEVTGSCFLCIVRFPNREKIHFVVDCGLFQEEDYLSNNYDFPFDCENLKFALVTHSHVDHVGRLPLLVKKGFRGKIYSSRQTARILPLALFDTQKILAETCKRHHEKRVYSTDDVERTLAQITGTEYNNKCQITPNISAVFLPNAHILGASMIFVEISYPGETPINVLFTGDYAVKNDFVDTSVIPEKIRNSRLNVLIESTYGTTSVKDVDYGYFQEKMIEGISTKSTVLIPVLSLGRAQQILFEIKKLQDNCNLDESIPVYFDGRLAQRYTKMFIREKLIKESMLDFLPKNLIFVTSDTRQKVLEDHETKKIIVTTSGMGTFGPAQVYIPHYISDEDSMIIFTSYVSEGTVGRILKDSLKGESVIINGLVRKKLSEVFYTTQFSSHAKSEELLELLGQFSNLRAVIVNHGESDVKENFANMVYKEISTRNVGIISRDILFRIGPFGIEKTIPTKFR